MKRKRESYKEALDRLFPKSESSAKPATAKPETAKHASTNDRVDDPFFIDSEELARRLNLPVSWIRDRVRRRHNPATRIPHQRFGKYVRFEWGSPVLTEWIEKHARR